jgi:hypothetical protein
MSRRRVTRGSDGPRPAAVERVEEHADGTWVVRSITGAASTKTYRCPGCDHEIVPATPHVVAWRDERGSDERRHWHTPCWDARRRRGPVR